jgi:prepilin-type N-terminal cleavage/methylation domain-containing protein
MSTYPRRQQGFTMIELLVVITIIAVIAVLLVPLLQYAQVRAMAHQCASRATAIGKCVFTYAARWNLWTCPDASFYVKEIGNYRLSTEPGYDAAVAKTVTDYRCPVDKNAIDESLNGHGYPTSYAITNTYVGNHIGRIRTASSDTLLLLEVGKADKGKRHPKDRAGAIEKHYVFGDGRVELGWNRGPLSGLYGRWWNDTTTNLWTSVRSDTPTTNPDYENVWSGGLTESNFGFLPRTGKTGNWGRDRGNPVDGILMRLDGYLQFPIQGQWHILSFFDDRVLFWIDVNRNGQMDGAEAVENNQVGTVRFLMTVNGMSPTLTYKCAVMYHESTGNNYFNFYWSQNPTAVTDPPNAPREVIPGTALFFIP